MLVSKEEGRSVASGRNQMITENEAVAGRISLWIERGAQTDPENKVRGNRRQQSPTVHMFERATPGRRNIFQLR